jgi:hypothetical protein
MLKYEEEEFIQLINDLIEINQQPNELNKISLYNDWVNKFFEGNIKESLTQVARNGNEALTSLLEEAISDAEMNFYKIDQILNISSNQYENIKKVYDYHYDNKNKLREDPKRKG